jgi:hypothetical protein
MQSEDSLPGSQELATGSYAVKTNPQRYNLFV